MMINCHNIESQFLDVMSSNGIATSDKIIADGKIHRVHIKGDGNGSKNGWYVLYANGIPSGAFGSWKAEINKSWCAKSRHDLTFAEKAHYKKRLNSARNAQEAEHQAIQDKARAKAELIWRASVPALNNHPYLIRKGVKAHAVRLHNSSLVIPMRDSAETLYSLQFINASGEKRFLSGGRKKGCYFAIGHLVETLCIAEGYATAASIHESTGHATAVAFDAGNLRPVAQALRDKFPSTKIVICADNDWNKPQNIGLTRAREAAAATGAYIAFPEDMP